MVYSFAGDKAVSTAKMFGTDVLLVGSKGFVMWYKDAMVFKLSVARVDALIASRMGGSFDPSGMGHAMKEWVAVGPAKQAQWAALAQEARAFVAKNL